MKVGLEANHLPGFKTRTPQDTLALVHELGFDGAFFKTLLDLSPTLDLGQLREIKQTAEQFGLYLECGVSRVNPYNTAESPEIRALGDGDYRLGVERMIRAARTIDCTELWAETATSANKPYPGYLNVDRFRTDVTWADQLLATEKFLRLLVPVLREVGSRLCVETHEEITSFEVVRLVEAIGPDVIGITFDTGNVVNRGEDPVAAARRVAPYTYLTHLKDPFLVPDTRGFQRQVYPLGWGIVNWQEVLAILGEHAPELHLTLEDHKGSVSVPLYDPAWHQHHPDLNTVEVAELFRLAQVSAERVHRGEIPDPAMYGPIPYSEQWRERVQQSAAHLRTIIAQQGWGKPV